MVVLSKEEQAALLMWIEQNIKDYCKDQNPKILSNYIKALVMRQASRQSMIALLREFIDDSSEPFVDRLEDHLKRRDFSIDRPTEASILQAPKPTPTLTQAKEPTPESSSSSSSESEERPKRKRKHRHRHHKSRSRRHRSRHTSDSDSSDEDSSSSDEDSDAEQKRPRRRESSRRTSSEAKPDGTKRARRLRARESSDSDVETKEWKRPRRTFIEQTSARDSRKQRARRDNSDSERETERRSVRIREPEPKPEPKLVERQHYVVCVPGLAENLNTIGGILREFSRFGEIIAVQENREKGYALIEYANLYAAFKAVRSTRVFFNNEYIRPFFAVPVGDEELRATEAEYKRRKEFAEELNRKRLEQKRLWQAQQKINGMNEEELLSEMVAIQEKKIKEFEQSTDASERDMIKNEIESLSSMIDMLAHGVLSTT